MTDWSESPNVSEQTYNAVQWGKKLERERILALLANPFWHDIQFPDIHKDCAMCDTIALIKGDVLD